VLTFDTSPHVLIAMRKLFDFSRVDLDSLCNIELDLVACRAENFLGKRKNDRFENKLFSDLRAAKQSSQALGPIAIEIAVAKRSLLELPIEFRFELRDIRDRKKAGNDAIAIPQEALCPL